MSNRELTPELLLEAYSIGVFPMSDDAKSDAIYWVNPKHRGIIPLEQFHVPKRLARTVRSGRYRVTINTCFEKVIRACAEIKRGDSKTWINEMIITNYTRLHHMGHAHSVEVWEGDKLVGGLYGISLGTAFFGESMFSTARDASKVALVHLVARLIKQGYTLLDAQFINDHLKQFGIIEIPREEYHGFLRLALAGAAAFASAGGGDAALEFLQSRTHTS
ncbi:MAG: leucyl/phenylalanyl-tRNA--protein transferase [Alphaproteobacteria bacterium]|nr:leucyl/phenylalanyl-tRNA--protein transferase [Alphaproteobacteria bacterium]